ncbi:MAG: hypothetical protein ACJ8D5_06715 [Sphingomicrobium sp.]
MTDSPPPIPTIPVVCDQCRASGIAGDERFAAIPDILAFDPVPRRAHANGWSPEHQRAFIAALAITGSPRQAARAIGRAQFGADQLRTAKGGRSFAAAWDAAMDLARDTELARLHGNLAELADQAATVRAEPPTHGRYILADPDEPDEDSATRLAEEVRDRMRERLLRARRLYLLELHADPAKRAAWETLCGPVDWNRVPNLEPQDNEPYAPAARDPAMILAAEHQWLAELTGGPCKTKVLGEAIAELRERSRSDK